MEASIEVLILDFFKYNAMYKKAFLPYYQLFDHAPMAAAILDVDQLKLEMGNQQVLKFWDKQESLNGVPLLDFLPELIGQRFPAYLEEVAKTGRVIQEKGARIMMERNGQPEWVYMDYSYSPIYSGRQTPSGILVLATDVCERELNRLVAQQSFRDLRTLVLSAPVAMCIYMGIEHHLEVANDRMLDLWQGQFQPPLHILTYVLAHKIPYKCIEKGIEYSYTPLGSSENGKVGVCVVACRTKL